MTDQYYTLINDLKTKLLDKRIGFKKVFKLINKYDVELLKDIDDEKNKKIIDKIINEVEIIEIIKQIQLKRIKIGESLENKLNDLFWLNQQLIKFNKEEQSSITKARTSLRKILINIYDLEAEKLIEYPNIKEMRKDLGKNPSRRYPLDDAKRFITLKCFIKNVF